MSEKPANPHPNMSNEIESVSDISAESAAFELLQRRAKMLASSTLVPSTFQGNMANCAIAINIAQRLRADVFMVMQGLDIIHGRPSWRAVYLISMVNSSGRFAPMEFEFSGEGDDYGCRAYATSRVSGNVVYGPKVTWRMVKAEGWDKRQGSKWKTMPEVMFTYRAGAFFAKIHAGDITLGMQTSEEILDSEAAPVRNVTPRVRPNFGAPLPPPVNELPDPAPEPAETMDPDLARELEVQFSNE